MATAPVQQRGWIGGPPAALVRPLFSRAAWCGYGLAALVAVIAALLVVQLAAGPVQPLPALVFVLVASTLWQCMIFLRTDLYGVLVTATGCRDLWRVKSLLLRRAVGRLDQQQRAELDQADPHDLRVGPWFRWVWLAGCGLAAGYFVVFYPPLLSYAARWAGEGFGAGMGSGRFWWGLVVALMVYAPIGVTLWMALRRVRRSTMAPDPVDR